MMKLEILNSTNTLQNSVSVDSFDDIETIIYPDTSYVKIKDIDIPFCKAQFLANTEREFNIPISFNENERWIRVDISEIKDNKTKTKTLLNIIYKHQC